MIPHRLHLLFHFLRRIDQAEPIEHCVDVGHAPDITEGLRTVNYRANTRYIMKGQQNGTPSQALAVLPPVDEQLLRVGISSPLLQTVGKYQPGIGAELVALELNYRRL